MNDPNGVYAAEGSPVSSFPSMYSETCPSQASQSQTYSQVCHTITQRLSPNTTRYSVTGCIHAVHQGQSALMVEVTNQVEANGGRGVIFTDLVEKIGNRKPAHRLDAARIFHDVLYMATKGKMCVDQKKAYGPIRVHLPAAAA